MPKRMFNIGDKVIHFGSMGTVSAIKMGGYLVNFPQSKNTFVYESELTSAESLLEDDGGKAIWQASNEHTE
jgi:hypothetical protein